MASTYWIYALTAIAWTSSLCACASIGSSEVTPEEYTIESLRHIEEYIREIKDILQANREGNEIQSELNLEQRLGQSPRMRDRGSSSVNELQAALNEGSKKDLMEMMSYFQYLKNNRHSADVAMGSKHKRQPPSGFHAVRGKRDLSKLSPSS